MADLRDGGAPPPHRGPGRSVVLVVCAMVAAVLLMALRACSPEEAPVTTPMTTSDDAAPPRVAGRARAPSPGESPAAEPSATASDATGTTARDASSPGAPATIDVRVLDASGAPAAGVTVFPVTRNGASPFGTRAVTDADGRARVTPAGGDAWRVRAARGVEVALGPVRLQSSAPETLRLCDAVAVCGRVVGPDGAPIPDAAVSVRTSSLVAIPILVRARTDERGGFRTEPIPCDRVDGPAGFEGESGVQVWVHSPGLFAHEVRYDARAVRAGEIVIRAERERHVTGRCVNEDGAAVPDATVLVRPRGGWARTGADGAFDAWVTDPAATGLAVHAEGRVVARVVLPALSQSPDGMLRGDVGDVVLRPGGAITGRVVDEAGEPVVCASVTLLADDGAFEGEAQSDGEGAFRIDGVGGGTYALTASDSGLGDAPRHGRVDVARAGDADVRITVRPGRAILVRLLAAEDGAPLVSDRQWHVVRPAGTSARFIEGERHGRSDGTLWIAVPSAGSWDIAVSVPDRAPALLRGVVAKDDEVTTVDAVLARE